MSTYCFLIRPIARIKNIYEYTPYLDKKGNRVFGEKLDNSLIIESDNVTFEIDDGFVSQLVNNEDERELYFDFPDDKTAIEFAEKLNKLCLDPWRVDFIFQDDREVCAIDY